jgi:hypothetical protein
MIDPLHQQLLGHLLGALDEDEERYVDVRLERDDDYCREFTRWRRRLSRLEALRPDFEPPCGLADRTCRLVDAYRSNEVANGSRRSPIRMSPCVAPPSHASRIAWPDVAAVVVLATLACALLLPAIDGSRIHAKLAACQDGMRHYAVELNEYGDTQGEIDKPQCPYTPLAGLAGLSPPGPPSWGFDDPIVDPIPELDRDWPGAWRDGMMDGRRLPLILADMPLTVDALSVEAPGQEYANHGGLGQNVLFEDGHTVFMPTTTTDEEDLWFLDPGDKSPPSKISVPIILVSGR